MSVDIEKLKSALNLDDGEDVTLLSGYLEAAKQFVKGAVGEDKSGKFYVQDTVSPLFDVAVISLAGAYYTYRIALADTQNYPIDLTLNSIIGQLRGLYADFDEVENHG